MVISEWALINRQNIQNYCQINDNFLCCGNQAFNVGLMNSETRINELIPESDQSAIE